MNRPRKKILVIDDEKDCADMLSFRLRKDGFIPATALDGNAGLIRARKFRPDIILLDIKMPGMDGWEVLRHLRAQPETRNAVVIVLTGIHQVEQAKKAGADGLILKPFEMDEVSAYLAKPIEHLRHWQQNRDQTEGDQGRPTR